jgi:hypothetical protein
MRSLNSINNPSFELDGFELCDVFTSAELSNICVEFHNRIMLQAYKLSLVEKVTFLEYGDELNTLSLDKLVIALHSKYKYSIDFVVQELRECPSFYALVNDKFLNISSRLLKCPTSLLKIHFDGILVNIPSAKQRLYRFHSEAHYYPYRKNFLNFWMPVIHNKTSENGAMLLKHSGHLKQYDFNEYSGFDKVEGDKLSENDYFYQLEIPASQIADCETLISDLSVGRGLFFHSNLPHSSTLNHSDLPSYALIARVYDYRKDLTLSDKTGIKLYEGGRGGYPGLRPLD